MVEIKLIGTNGTPEYAAAQTLKELFERDIDPKTKCTILIASGVTCFGQETKDIDIVVLGYFETGFARRIRSKAKRHGNGEPEESAYRWVNISNFCFCIEVKDQEHVQFQSSRASVIYRGKLHDVTYQSEKQKYALKGFLEETLKWSPYICNFIWFRNVDRNELPKIPHNWISSTPSLDWILHLAFDQHFPVYFPQTNSYTFSCSKNNEQKRALYEFETALQSFSRVSENLGKLTREKLERITKTLLKNQQYAQALGEKLLSIEGRAGTGKTIKLLHIARDLCVEHDKRCLILTYNKALVSDIRRLIALARIDTSIASATIEVKTVHSFLRNLMIGFGILNPSNNKLFLEDYDSLKQQLLAFLTEELITKSDIQKLMKERYDEVAWDTILIDEAQDWPEDEKEILFKIFKPEIFVIADGVDQLVRSQHRTNWKLGIDCHRQRERVSLRQKANLCRFQQYYAESIGLDWDIIPKDDLIGGQIFIVEGDYKQKLHHQLLKDCRSNGNQPYEMLFAAPPSLVVRESIAGKINRHFALTKQGSEWDVRLWDGTSEELRSDYPNSIDEFRIVQYESCRGLEGWTVICLWLDDFIKYKQSTFDEQSERQLRLGLQGDIEARQEYAYKWSMIPLTRAVDTLVITLKDPKSDYAAILRKVADKCKDFVEWIA